MTMAQKKNDLRYNRAHFVLNRIDRLLQEAERLQSAPLAVRRLGLPLALATWERESRPALVELVRDWLYEPTDADPPGWGMMPVGESAGRDVVSLIKAFDELDQKYPRLRSAIEREAEELLQVAKVLVDAATGRKELYHG
jgi:hypothetical protein